MKTIAKRLWNNPIFFAASANGTVAALVTAEILPPWATLISVALFAPRPGK